VVALHVLEKIGTNSHLLIDIDFASNLDALIDTPGKRSQLTSCYLPDAIKNPITIYTMLLAGAQFLEKPGQISSANRQARYYTRFYRGRLLQMINEAFNDSRRTIDDFTIAGLVKLEADAVSSTCF